MNQKLRILLLIVLGIVIGAVAAVAGLRFWTPLSAPAQQEASPLEAGQAADKSHAQEAKKPDSSQKDKADPSRSESEDEDQEDDGHAAGGEEVNLPLDELRKFVTIMNRARTGYVEDVSDKKLLDNAMHGMLERLDPHSSYLEPDEYKTLKISTSGKFGGLGVQVQKKPGYLKVISPIDDTPASKAGIRPGDMIVRIDGKPVKGMTMTQAVHRMRGKPDTRVKLVIVRENASKPIEAELKRAYIHVKSVRHEMLEDGYGYIRISQFSRDTGRNLGKALDALRKDADDRLEGLVLDLRNNPGGVVEAAVEVSDYFLKADDTVVAMKGRGQQSDRAYKARHDEQLAGMPIVVLVNQGTASAAEIVSGALQDHKRAVIMGSKTFGKGSVQTVMPFKDGSAIKFTTARYYTPSGRSIQAEGIKPDIRLARVKLLPDQPDNALSYSEADLSGVLQNTGSNKTHDDRPDNDGHQVRERTRKALETQPEAKSDASGRDEDNPLSQSDYGVYEALNLLKGLNAWQLPSNPEQLQDKAKTKDTDGGKAEGGSEDQDDTDDTSDQNKAHD